MVLAMTAKENIQQFAAEWFRMLDTHASVDACWRMLTDDGLHMHFPDVDIRDFATFRGWYDRVTHLFFDEKHSFRNIEVRDRATDSQVDVAMVVAWQTRWWTAPAAESAHVDLEVSQKWVVRRCETKKNPLGLEIVSYIVGDDFTFAPGSAALPPSAASAADELIALNHRIGKMEQEGGIAALKFFNTHLADSLVFRRADGRVVGKFGPGGFLSTLDANPFQSRDLEDITVNPVDGRMLVTLIVVGTRRDDASVHRYRNIRSFFRPRDEWIMEFWYNYEIPGM
jgi:hypothetical protein